MENLGIYYANDNHLSIILVEYLKKKAKEKCKVITVFEKSIQKEINKVLKESKIKNEFIKEIDFNAKKEIENIKEDRSKEIIIIFKGSNEYISKNLQIAKSILNNENTGNIKLVKCYKIGEQNGEISKNIKENSKIISTTGEHKIK